MKAKPNILILSESSVARSDETNYILFFLIYFDL